jgi:hypothetical protein
VSKPLNTETATRKQLVRKVESQRVEINNLKANIDKGVERIGEFRQKLAGAKRTLKAIVRSL